MAKTSSTSNNDTNEMNNAYSCDKCKDSFSHKQALSNHIKFCDGTFRKRKRPTTQEVAPPSPPPANELRVRMLHVPHEDKGFIGLSNELAALHNAMVTFSASMGKREAPKSIGAANLQELSNSKDVVASMKKVVEVISDQIDKTIELSRESINAHLKLQTELVARVLGEDLPLAKKRKTEDEAKE